MMFSVVPSMSRGVMPTSVRLMTTLRSEATGDAMRRVSSGAFFSGGVWVSRLSLSKMISLAAPADRFGAMFSIVGTFVTTPSSSPVFSNG